MGAEQDGDAATTAAVRGLLLAGAAAAGEARYWWSCARRGAGSDRAAAARGWGGGPQANPTGAAAASERLGLGWHPVGPSACVRHAARRLARPRPADAQQEGKGMRTEGAANLG
ncbi:uncharacterized protein ACIGJ3_018675 isoform 1-T3 [Trichechus inunguis]